MWREMEEEAIYMGLQVDYFWSLNPKQYAKHCKMYLKKEEHEAKLTDRLNHILGQYVGIAVNDGKKYPKNPFLEKTDQVEKKEQTVEDMEKVARYNTLFMGGEIKNDNRRVTSTDNG